MNFTPPLDPAALEQVFGLYRLPRLVFAAAQIGLADHLLSGPRRKHPRRPRVSR
jgi:hypothetical protein